MRHDQLVRIALFLGQRRAGLDPLFRILDGAVHGFAAAAEPKGSDHEPRVAEHPLRLGQALSLDAAEQLVCGHVNVVEHHGGRVAVANAVFVFGFAVAQAFGTRFHEEPARTAGRHREYGVQVRKAAIADPLLCATYFVALNVSVVADGVGPCF